MATATAKPTVSLPGRLLQFLGPRKGQPLVPFTAQADLLTQIKIPWPGLDAHGAPYPLTWGLCCGRQFSKTTILEVLMWMAVTAPEDDFGPPVVRMTADTEEHALKVWRKFVFHAETTPLAGLIGNYSREHERFDFKNGANLQMVSAKNPQNMAGDTVSAWFVDEAQDFSLAAYENMIPSTVVRNGVIVMAGVAEHEGPFREVCFKGMSPDYPDFGYISKTTAENPLISAWTIENQRKRMSPMKFRQLYLAEWVGELGKIFRNVEGCILHGQDGQINVAPEGYGRTALYIPGHAYYAGLDLARLQDWTVFTIWDRTGKLVAWDRFNLVDWELQKARVAQLSKIYGNPLTHVDSTGIGDPIFDDLSRMGMNAVEYKISSNERKRALIDELAVRIGAGQIRYPRIPVFIEELNRFEAKRANEAALTVRYEAPSGGTDDFVISAALAMQGLPRPSMLATLAPGASLERHMGAYESL